MSSDNTQSVQQGTQQGQQGQGQDQGQGQSFGRGFGRGRRGDRRGRGFGRRGERRGERSEGDGKDGEGRGERRGRGRGDRRGRRGDRRGRGEQEKAVWSPVTKLGRLVKDGKVKTLEEIYLFSLPIKEYQIVEEILGEKLKDEVFKISPVQKQTQAGQRTKFRAIVVVGDFDGHIGLGSKVSKEVATAIRGAIQDAKCNVIPVRRGFWGIKFGAPHTVPCSVTGKTGSVRVRLVPAPRGTGLVGAKVTKKFLTMAGIKDVYSSTQGYTRTVGNFLGALFSALRETYSYLTPDMWTPTHWESSLYQKFTDHLRDSHKPKTDLSAKKSS